MKHQTVLIVGHAKISRDVASRSVYESIAFSVEIDRKYGVIVDCEPTILIESGRDFIKRLIVGLSLEEIDEICRRIEENYHGNALPALIAALKDIYRQYNYLKDNKKL
ncbi:DUF3870 domain-containing protein [Neomoorella carbonis]|uniref:DUF3870 domain-containing protein n=1 Tax=Neomoorella carbonis TaxID=3062783 RepID=UPI00324CB697